MHKFSLFSFQIVKHRTVSTTEEFLRCSLHLMGCDSAVTFGLAQMRIDIATQAGKSQIVAQVLTANVPNADANKLRQMGDTLKDKAANVVAVLSSVNGEKITILAVCGKEAIAKGVKAGDLVKTVCTACGGSGGGKPDSAMGGGKDALKLDDALAQVDNFVASKLG